MSRCRNWCSTASALRPTPPPPPPAVRSALSSAYPLVWVGTASDPLLTLLHPQPCSPSSEPSSLPGCSSPASSATTLSQTIEIGQSSPTSCAHSLRSPRVVTPSTPTQHVPILSTILTIGESHSKKVCSTGPVDAIHFTASQPADRPTIALRRQRWGRPCKCPRTLPFPA